MKWPAWEDAAFYMQEPEVMYASIAAQRDAAPVYWYEPPGYPTRVLGAVEVGAPALRRAATPSCSPASTGSPSATPAIRPRSSTSFPSGPREGSARARLSPAETRRTIAHGQALHGRPQFREPDHLRPSASRADPQHHDEGAAAQPGAEPEARVSPRSPTSSSTASSRAPRSTSSRPWAASRRR